jgi:hypothetical protein
MAKTIKEYRSIIDTGGFLIALQQEGWDNLVDNILDYDGIPVDWDDPESEAKAWELRDEEERKVSIALREFLEGRIEEFVPEATYHRMPEEGDEFSEQVV